MPVAEEGLELRGVVGRHSERRRIEAALGSAATEGGVAVLISGPTGVGKTALAAYALTRAEQRGFLTMKGVSNPLNQEVAYGPIIEAFGRALHEFEPPERSRLVNDLPALGQLFVGLDLPVPQPLDNATLEKTRLFEAVLRILDRMARRTPVAVLLDDLHWFDRASVELLAYFTRDISALPVLVVGTYRSDGPANDRMLQLLQLLRRAGIAEEIELAPLTRTDVGEMSRLALGGEVSERVVDILATRSAGIPLFADAMIDSMRVEGTLFEESGVWMVAADVEPVAPPVAREAIREQFKRLTADERDLLDLIAVGGGQLSWRVLREMSLTPAPERGLGHLVESGLVVEDTSSEVTFATAHPFVLQVVYDDVPGSRRRRLHARFARLLDELTPEDLDSRAFHYGRALPEVDKTRAARVTLAAGRSALERYANSEALTHLNTALELVQSLPDRSEVLRLAAEARFRLGDIEGAVTVWEDSLAGFVDDPEEIARINLAIARALAEVPTAESERYVAAGLEASKEVGADDLAVDLWFISTVTAHRQAEVDRIDEAVRNVTAAAERAGTQRARALAAIARTYATLDRYQYDEAETILDAAEPALRGCGAELAARYYIFRAVIAGARADLPGLRHANGQAARLARETGLPTLGPRLQIGMFVEAFYGGEWERAHELVSETMVAAETIGHKPSLMLADLMHAVLHIYRGDFDAAAEHIKSAQMKMGTTTAAYTAHVRIGTAVAALEQNDPAKALQELDLMDAPWASGTLPPWEHSVRGEALARLGRTQEAFETTRQLGGHGSDVSYPKAMAGRIEGLTYHHLGEIERAVQHLQEATDIFERLGLPFEEARTGIELAEIATAAGLETDDLAPSVRRWHEITTKLGARRYVDRSRRLLHAMNHPLPTEGEVTDLTPRQLEVAELVAEGLSNSEIAEQLFISVRTVESHLDHIYTKLGLNSRVSLATYLTQERTPP